ncbi:MAG: hypothetical protein FWC89_06025 [Defluviitaleaceae bacterium]|nr:hypothetical protein [Defluviitaleaceae bacterium]
MKKLLVLAMLVIAGTLFVACGGNNASVERTPALVGTWAWEGLDYYVLNADGSGTMIGSSIMWWTNNSVLHLCLTPDICRTPARCSSSADWNYSIAGNELTLDSTIAADMVFVYTRN